MLPCQSCTKLVHAAEEGNLALMKEMRSTLGRKNLGQAIPESLDGKGTHDAILERFKERYEGLYNSAGTEEAMDTIKAKLHSLIQEDKISGLGEIGKVTGKIGKQACGRRLP